SAEPLESLALRLWEGRRRVSVRPRRNQRRRGVAAFTRCGGPHSQLPALSQALSLTMAETQPGRSVAGIAWIKRASIGAAMAEASARMTAPRMSPRGLLQSGLFRISRRTASIRSACSDASTLATAVAAAFDAMVGTTKRIFSASCAAGDRDVTDTRT